VYAVAGYFSGPNNGLTAAQDSGHAADNEYEFGREWHTVCVRILTGEHR
jgi:hypothetical protein